MSSCCSVQMSSELPILETRKVLLEHLQAKIHPLCLSTSNEDEVILKITQNLSDSEIIRLLEDEVLLEEAVSPYILKEEEAVGELLFVAVASIDSELCAQITGMLLELDKKTIEALLTNRSMLQVAVEKAKKEYLKFAKCSEISLERVLDGFILSALKTWFIIQLQQGFLCHSNSAVILQLQPNHFIPLLIKKNPSAMHRSLRPGITELHRQLHSNISSSNRILSVTDRCH